MCEFLNKKALSCFWFPDRVPDHSNLLKHYVVFPSLIYNLKYVVMSYTGGLQLMTISYELTDHCVSIKQQDHGCIIR